VNFRICGLFKKKVKRKMLLWFKGQIPFLELQSGRLSPSVSRAESPEIEED
jgi:hypothetical protein